MSQMLSFESRLDILQGGSGGGSQSSANSASRGNNRNSGNREPSSRGRGPSWRGCGAGGRGRGASNSGGQKAHFNGQCQVCFKEGHNATYCWHRFDANYVPEEKHTNTATHHYDVDGNWYTDTGATDHITSEHDKLVIHDKYNGPDQIRTQVGQV
jgi:hypothetical protein